MAGRDLMKALLLSSVLCLASALPFSHALHSAADSLRASVSALGLQRGQEVSEVQPSPVVATDRPLIGILTQECSKCDHR